MHMLFMGALCALMCALVSAFALVPAYAVLYVTKPIIPASAGVSATSTQDDTAAIVQAKALLSTLTSIATSSSPAERIALVLNARPAGILVEHVALTHGTPGTLVLAGSANDSVALNRYQNTLRTVAGVTSVNVPINDLAGAGNGDFTITLTGDF